MVNLISISTKPLPIKNSLGEVFKDFQDQIPLDNIKELIFQRYATDLFFQQAILQLKSEEFENLWSNLISHEASKDLVSFFANEGLDLRAFFLKMGKLIPEGETEVFGKNPTFQYFIEEVEEEIPIWTLKKLIKVKCEESAEFRNFWLRVTGVEAATKVYKVTQTGEFSDITEFLWDYGVDVSEFLKFVYKLLGWV